MGGSALLVWETRLTLAILAEETRLIVDGLHLKRGEASAAQVANEPRV